MWSSIVAGLVVAILATYALQLFVPRAPARVRRNYARWDVAPLLGFIAALLLALSFVEALRRAVIEAWGIGLGVGLVVSLVCGIVLVTSRDAPVRPKESAFLATLRLVRAYGVVAIAASLGLYVAVRLVGVALEVLFASAFGVWLMTMAMALFVRGRIAEEEG